MMFDRKIRPDTFSSAYTILILCLLAFNAGWQVFVPTTNKKIPPMEGFNSSAVWFSSYHYTIFCSGKICQRNTK